MELIFNELSLQPTILEAHSANVVVEKLIKTYAKAKKMGFTKIRFHKVFEEIVLSENYSFSDWLKTTTNRTYKDLLLAARVYPFIPEQDEWAEREYLQRRYFFENDFIQRTEPQGLAAALIYETLAVSLHTHEYWEKEYLSVWVIDDSMEGRENAASVCNVCEEVSLDAPNILDFVGKIMKPVLLPTSLPPGVKIIHLRDDHGKDIIEKFARRLVQSEYVVGVINSLPFNPKATNLIRKTYSDGKIEIVLYWEDAGYGLVVQTTGRNIHETNAIAEILKEQYDD